MNSNAKEVTLLVVEDDDVDAKIVARVFKKLKIANPTFRAKDGIEALEYLRGENNKEKIKNPLMILLDLNMPRMNGLEFLDEIRSDPGLRRSVVFVLTTSASDKDKLAAYDRYIAGYIVKAEIKKGFLEILELLDCYWKIVALPS